MVDYSKVVEQVVDQLFGRFRATPSLFFTESDLVCEFYRLFLSQVPDPYARDAEGKEHLLIHTEYPTPFRCDMSKNGFFVKGDEEPTNRGTKYKRGHLDLVILNPYLIRELKTKEVMMQDYQKTKDRVLNSVSLGWPMVVHAIEFQYHRGELTKEGAKRFAEIVDQDQRKLAACHHPKDGLGIERFVERYESLVFFEKSSSARIYEMYVPAIGGIRLCHP
jgi:hypothetical protein